MVLACFRTSFLDTDEFYGNGISCLLAAQATDIWVFPPQNMKNNVPGIHLPDCVLEMYFCFSWVYIPGSVNAGSHDHMDLLLV